MTNKTKKPLSVFGLVMFNIIAIDSLRTLPISAEYGFSLVFYYLIAALTFFIPTALVSAELASAWHEMGGIYVWVRQAFGAKWGFFTIWLQWFYNICWYPTIMSLIAATLAYCFQPDLVNNKAYMLSVILVLFWGATFLNFFGMRASLWLSSFSALIGTLIPMIFISVLGVSWVVLKKPVHIHFDLPSFIPNFNSINDLVLLTSVLYSLVGMELSAVHASEVANPQRDYPKALLWSVIIILASLILSSLAIAIVIPTHQLNIVNGVLQAFEVFFQAFHLQFLMPVVALLIVCGAIGMVNAWVLGPAKALLIASRDGCLPASLGYSNEKNVPVRILLLQGIIFTCLCSTFLLLPTVSSSFWLLSNITAILALGVYVMMFLAAICLRYKYPDVPRSFTIPGGKFGLWLTCLLGLGSSVFVIVLGFFPPSQIAIGNVFEYEGILIAGVVIACILPWLISRFNR